MRRVFLVYIQNIQNDKLNWEKKLYIMLIHKTTLVKLKNNKNSWASYVNFESKKKSHRM